MKKIIIVLFAMAAIITAAGCSANTPSQTASKGTADKSKEEAAYINVDVKEAAKLIEQGITIIDVRTPEEYKTGHIANAQLIPLQEIEARINEFSVDKQYLIVCRSGNRSAQSSEILTKNGMKNIYNMTGGMNEWTGEVVTE